DPNANQEALRASGLDRLHQSGQRGQGVRVAIVDSDFRGWENQLPPGTRLLDLTAELGPDLLPEPYPDDQQAVGAGTQWARAVALAAPEAALTLVRIDPASPHQLLAVARYLAGE